MGGLPHLRCKKIEKSFGIFVEVILSVKGFKMKVAKVDGFIIIDLLPPSHIYNFVVGRIADND